MDLERTRTIRRAIIKAIFSVDELMDRLVLKGGNAIDLIHGAALRASEDLDFSMEGDFDEGELPDISRRIETRLSQEMQRLGLEVFDLKMVPQPPEVSEDMADFWGGYLLTFKLITTSLLHELGDAPEALRVRAEPIGLSQRRSFRVEISKHEHCREKQRRELDHILISVYSHELIVAEKIRSICQQTEEYSKIAKRSGRSRAKDFFDICCLVDHWQIDLTSTDFHELLRAVFDAKRVPLHLLGRIEPTRELHRDSHRQLKDTVKVDMEPREFDFYFDRVLQMISALESLWVEESPPL